MLWILFLFDILTILAHIFLRKSLGFFDLDKEGNLSSFYAGIKLWIGATGAFLYAWYLQRSKSSRALVWAWIAFAMMLAYLGIDDMMVIHERLGFVINNRLRINGYYGESFNWLIYFSPLAFLGVVVLYIVARNLWCSYRTPALLIGIGASIMVLSLLVEAYSGYLLTNLSFSIHYYYFLIIMEESFEMIGTSCVVGGILYAMHRIAKDKLILKEILA